jgi:hypothetical protein
VLAICRARSNPVVRGVVLRRVRVRAPLGPRGEEEASLRWVHGRLWKLMMLMFPCLCINVSSAWEA